MIFIGLLTLSTFAIAFSAAYFSVYGLAATFSGVFWSVVIMGASLEAGKLIAASYLYRYWDRTNILLKLYLMAGVAALMILTSTGIFGYLSSGYQMDVLPLKQTEMQINLLEEEKVRKLDRKRQIDDEITKLPSLNVGALDLTDAKTTAAATRALKETRLVRDSALKSYKVEQAEVTKRITQLDTEILTLKQTLIKTEAHIGPITYIARAFNVETDDATKWLVFLIIFAFDPMAVALTLAVNTAIRIRAEERGEKSKPEDTPAPIAPQPEPGRVELPAHAVWPEPAPAEEPVVEPVVEEPVVEEPVVEPVVEQPAVEEPAPVEVAAVEPPAPRRHTRPYTGRLEGISATEKIDEIITHYRHLKGKQVKGTLTPDEEWDIKAIEQFLQKKGLDIYLK